MSPAAPWSLPPCPGSIIIVLTGGGGTDFLVVNAARQKKVIKASGSRKFFFIAGIRFWVYNLHKLFNRYSPIFVHTI
jgi:hypothetical protein